jgi:hypothetical protein
LDAAVVVVGEEVVSAHQTAAHEVDTEDVVADLLEERETATILIETDVILAVVAATEVIHAVGAGVRQGVVVGITRAIAPTLVLLRHREDEAGMVGEIVLLERVGDEAMQAGEVVAGDEAGARAMIAIAVVAGPTLGAAAGIGAEGEGRCIK